MGVLREGFLVRELEEKWDEWELERHGGEQPGSSEEEDASEGTWRWAWEQTASSG